VVRKPKWTQGTDKNQATLILGHPETKNQDQITSMENQNASENDEATAILESGISVLSNQEIKL